MVTIYLDKQIFSHLFNPQEDKYIRLRDKILSHKDEFIFVYSDGHLLDLQQDTTDIKYNEMEFMESIVNSNRLLYNSPNIYISKESPKSAFGSIGELGDFSGIENFDLSQLSQEQIDAINNVVDITVSDLTGQLDFKWITDREPIYAKELQVDKDTLTNFVKFLSDSFYGNPEAYRIVRDNTISKYNPSEIRVSPESVFNTQLAQSPLGLSFIEVIQAILKQVGITNNDMATVYQMAYVLLDMLGASKEPRRKVRFRNMQIDCFHSFFGIYCDCLVSNDVGMLNKSKALYQLFNIGTRAYTIDEFIESFDRAIDNNQKNLSEYIDEIFADYKLGYIVKVDESSEFTITHLKSSHNYFGYFNYMIERKSSSNKTALILHKNNDIYQPIHVEELQIIVNRISSSFQDAGAVFYPFDKDTELPLMKEDNWQRSWILDGVKMYLTKFKGVPMLCFVIEFE